MKESTELIIKSILKNQTNGNHWIIDQIKNNIDKIKIKDCSKGCDNNVFLISYIDDDDGDNQEYDDNKIIIRIPRRLNSENYPFMHTPLMQSRLLQVLSNIGLDSINIQIPKLLSLDTKYDQYMIESYLPENDLSEVFSTPSEMNDDQCFRVFSKVGEILSIIHNSKNIKTSKFGSLKSIELEGTLNNWCEFFEPSILEQFQSISINLSFIQKDHSEFKSTNQIRQFLLDFYYEHIKQLLIEFNQPTLVHADLCSNNIRVNKINKDSGQIIKVLGIIDFADCISGDGLYDLGRILSHVYGDWRFIEALEFGYLNNTGNSGDGNKFTKTQYKLIIFYALSFCVWLLDISSEDCDLNKYNKILSNLIKLIKIFK